MSGTMETSGELNWLLDELVSQVPQIRHAVVLSGDGLPIGASEELPRDDKERFAAIASGFHSLAKGAGRHFQAGQVIQTWSSWKADSSSSPSAGEGSCLSVFTDADADVGLVAYEMARLVTRVAEHLGVSYRTDDAAAFQE